MTFRVGAAGSSGAAQKVAHYYLDDTVQSETQRAAIYYTGIDGRHEQTDGFWHAAIMNGHLEMVNEGTRQHHAELRADLSAEFSAKLGLHGQALTPERVANLLSLQQADGGAVEGRKKHSASPDGKRPATGFVDFTFSASKSLSVAWGLAPNREEREQLIGVHRAAVLKTMGFVEEEIGFTQRGGAKRRREEPGEIAWVGFQHFTSRPVGELVADPNLHTHVIVLNHVLTEGGHIGALNLDRLQGKVKLFGAVYEAHVATEARKLGIAVHFDERRETTQLSDIPDHVNDLFSKRSQQAAESARKFAQESGVEWETLSDEQKAELNTQAAHITRQSKRDGETNDFASWSEQADEAGYRYESVLGRVEVPQEQAAPRPDHPEPIDELSSKLVAAIEEALRYREPVDQADRLIWELDRIVIDHKASGEPTPRLAQDLMRVIQQALMSQEPEPVLVEGADVIVQQHAARVQAHQERLAQDRSRQEKAYETALPRLQEEFRRRAVLDEQELRRVSAQALITTGIKDAGADIDAIMCSFRKAGVEHQGQRVSLVEHEAAMVRGTRRVRVTTVLHIAEERELIRLAQAAAADRSAGLPATKVAEAARSFLSQHPEIDAAGPRWEAQRGMIDHLATGGRLGVVMGIAGAGKSVSLGVLTQAWKEEGRSVYGVSLAWRQATDLAAAGIGERASIAAFLKRVESGRYELDRNSVVVVDEVGLVGSRQMLDLLRIQERTGAQMVMIGDPRQNNAIEGAAGLELLRTALGEEAIPRLLHSTRQHSEREREIAALIRRGQVAEALDMKQEDGTAVMVPGGREATIARVAELWRARLEANREKPDFTLSVSAPTNADAREIGAAIRAETRRMGRLGSDLAVMRAVDRTGETYDLPLAIGDKLRLFDRIWDPSQHCALASNGDIVELRALRADGMVVRTAAGDEGVVPWDKIRARPDAPIRLTYGYATTIDVAQGSTVFEHVSVLPSGSQASHGFKAYVAATRHREINWLIVDGASERRAIEDRSMLGHRVEISDEKLWQNVATNLSRFPEKPTAISVVQQRPPQSRQRAA